jgi:hypothetical protein
MNKLLIVLTSILAFASAAARSVAQAPSTPATCMVVVGGSAGVLNGNYPCSPRVVYDSTQHALVFALTLSTPGSGNIVQLTIAFEAPQIVPRADRFTLGTGGITGGATLKEVAGTTTPVWAALKSDTSSLLGTSTLELTDLGPATHGKQQYLSPKGSISATLEPQDASGANGTVTLQVTF